jgi:hypothetical protein
VGLMRTMPKFTIITTNDLKLFCKIALLESKSKRMRDIRNLDNFSWVDWYSLEDDIAKLYSQTGQFKDIIENINSKYQLNYD